MADRLYWGSVMNTDEKRKDLAGTSQRTKLRRLERRLGQMRTVEQHDVIDRLEHNLSAQSLLAQWQVVLRGEQELLIAHLRADDS